MNKTKSKKMTDKSINNLLQEILTPHHQVFLKNAFDDSEDKIPSERYIFKKIIYRLIRELHEAKGGDGK